MRCWGRGMDSISRKRSYEKKYECCTYGMHGDARDTVCVCSVVLYVVKKGKEND
jgi:hypothetical protein